MDAFEVALSFYLRRTSELIGQFLGARLQTDDILRNYVQLLADD